MLDTLTLVVLPALVLWLSWMKYRGLEYVLINYRWVFVVFFLMPVSLAYDLFFYARSWLIFRMNSAPDKHDDKVRRVQQQVCATSLLISMWYFGSFELFGPAGPVAYPCFGVELSFPPSSFSFFLFSFLPIVMVLAWQSGILPQKIVGIYIQFDVF